VELRTYLEILRRRRAVIIAATLIVALVAGVVSSLKTPVYTASAQVLLRPNDPSEQITQQNQPQRNSADADRYVSAQLDIVEGAAVATAAVKDLKGVTVKQLAAGVDASQAGATDIIKVSAVDPDPARAAQMANAVANAYIQNRKDTAVAGLQKASDELEVKLTELEQRISTLDNQIDAETSAETEAHAKVQAKKKPTVITQPVTQPDGTVVQVPVQQTPVDDNFTPTENEALSAARYAAAVQYQSLYGQQQNLLVTKSLKKGEAELITTAEVPTTPSAPRPKRDTALGLFVGLLLGLGIAFLREQLDDKIRNRADAEELSKLPVIAELPLDAVKIPTEVAAHERPLGVLAESVRSLRTSLTFLGVDGPLRRIVVTSSEPGDGKSYVAANLAAIYAQNGLRTVLVSADLRRPRLDTMFPTVTAGPGLAEVITSIGAPAASLNGNGWHPVIDGVAAGILAKALRPTHIEGLSLLPAGQLPPNPAEILGSDKALQLLDALAGLADVVIIDTPPVLAVTDAAVLASNTDGVILVAAADQTRRGALTHAVVTLGNSHARMLGIVLNKVENTGGGSYGYRDRYYGAYYGTYTNDTDKKRGRFSRRVKPQDAKADSKVEVLG
jgi:capsular exopolysaccharide synthesis family protein